MRLHLHARCAIVSGRAASPFVPKNFDIPVSLSDGTGAFVDLTAGGTFSPGRVMTVIVTPERGWSGLVELDISGTGAFWELWYGWDGQGRSSVSPMPTPALLIRARRTGAASGDPQVSVQVIVETEPAGVRHR